MIPKEDRLAIYKLRRQGKQEADVSYLSGWSKSTIRRHIDTNDQTREEDKKDYIPPGKRGGSTPALPTTPEVLKKAFRARKEGASESDIAQNIFKTPSVSRVTKILNRNKDHPDFEHQVRISKVIPEKLRSEIIRRIEDEGQSYAQVAAATGITRGSVAGVHDRWKTKNRGVQEMNETLLKVVKQVINESHDEDLKTKVQRRANVASASHQTAKAYMNAMRKIANMIQDLENTHGLPPKGTEDTHNNIIKHVDNMQRKLSARIGETTKRMESEKRTLKGFPKKK
jgi:transposase